MKKAIFVLSLLLLVGVVVASIGIKEVKCDEASTIFYCDSDDGHLSNTNSNYDTAWMATTGWVTDSSNWFTVGQRNQSGNYAIYRSVLFFDTSTIPDNMTVISAVLSLYCYQNYSTTDFNITIQKCSPSIHKPLEAGDYYKSHYSGNYGEKNSSTLPDSGYWNITVETPSNLVSLTSWTKICLRSEFEIDGTAPDGNEYIHFYSTEQGSSYAPKLYVTYGGGFYDYIVHGPYFEDGTVANKFINLTLQIENLPNQKYVLNGTDGIADTLNISVAQKGVCFTWNLTGSQNYTRIYCLTSAYFEEIWIFIPTGNVYLYSFEVNNFAGVTNAYIETVINVGGQNRIVERQSLEVIYLFPFYMIYGHHYTLRVISDEGTYTWGDFIASSETAMTLNIRGVDFPKATLYKFKYVRIYAFRLYGNITIIYEDLLNMTNSVAIYIKYLNGSNAYTATETDNAFVHQWLNAINSTNYYAYVIIDHNRYGAYGWKQLFPRYNTVNPFDFSFLGTASFDTSVIIAVGIVLLTGCAFSVLNPEIGAFAACGVATFLNFLGWLPLPAPLLIAAWCFTFLFALAMAKVKVKT